MTSPPPPGTRGGTARRLARPLSKYPALHNDISFWLPEDKRGREVADCERCVLKHSIRVVDRLHYKVIHYVYPRASGYIANIGV
ncbi:hypothetical protein CRUP_021898 [Coryphaenoides rupestris]|nr:hypothetical protein CRUP_021898 [Coryphaenoides rupestris]